MLNADVNKVTLSTFQLTRGWIKADAENICARHHRMVPKRAGHAHGAAPRPRRARHEPPQQARAAPTGDRGCGRAPKMQLDAAPTARASAWPQPERMRCCSAYGTHARNPRRVPAREVLVEGVCELEHLRAKPRVKAINNYQGDSLRPRSGSRRSDDACRCEGTVQRAQCSNRAA